LSFLLCTFALAATGCGAQAPPAQIDWAPQRQQMVEQQLRGRDIGNERVLAAMGRVPRHEFVPDAVRPQAYEDYPLPIGLGQTISQPYIVALMTEVIDPQPGQRVLEVGTGSGYQAAVLAELVGKVYTIELLPDLAQQAQARLERLGYGNVEVRAGDGYQGWPEAAPFDAILVTCGADHVPEPLFEQLKPGGTLIIPVGETPAQQWLRVVQKGPRGERQARDLAPVRFVPLRRAGEQRGD
jgi:protein-L-isoaspartate(D-aspartate) O-methyltransferase